MNPLVVQGAAQLLLGKYKSQKGLLMKNILTMGATGLVIFAGLGWYLDWYRVNRTTGPDGKQHVTIDFNTGRIQTDIQKGRDQVGGFWQTQQQQQRPGGGFPSPTQPVPGQQPAWPAQWPQQQPAQQPYQQPFQQQPAQPQFPGFQPPPTSWAPAAPASRPSGGFTFPGQQPPQQVPGRPF